jgi:MYXO-CTERM domain-containing protein
MNRTSFRKLGFAGALAAGLATATALLMTPAPVHACGGLFCSSTNPVNQAAEQIIFVDNPDGSVTAVIQIMYAGPAHKFAWVLPVPGTPTVGVSSEMAFGALKTATNPLYQLTTTYDPSCANGPPFSNAAMGSASAGSGASQDAGSGVSVVSSGAIGPYQYDTIMVDPTLDDPADAAIKWFEANAYDVGALGPDVLRPYLKEGLNLLAFKLDKSATAGSIRPVMITYQSGKPSIPIRPTAVAANDDMGVMVFLLSKARGIPENYKALELNEALIDWFNANNNYNAVVSAAADEAQGQGFVTEFAGKHSALGLQILPTWQRDAWTTFQNQQFTDPLEMISQATNQWGGWDGFDDALQKAVSLPEGVAFSDFKNCGRCYVDDPAFAFNTSTFRRQLYELVIKPMSDTQALFDSRPYLTRLYTTMSADEMTMDPVFAFNPDLSDVSNVHTAEQQISCNEGGNAYASDAPWTVKLPQGDMVRGAGLARVWPISTTSQPAAIRILQFGTSGEGKVLEDRADAISAMIEAANPPPKSGSTTKPATAGSGGTGGKGGASGSTSVPGAKPGLGLGGSGGSARSDAGVVAKDDDSSSKDDGGCNVAHGGGSNALSLMLLAGLALLRRRRS